MGKICVLRQAFAFSHPRSFTAHNLKTCKKALAGTRAKYILQTNNKNPILHLITRSVKQKEGKEKGRNKLLTTAAVLSPEGRRSSTNPPSSSSRWAGLRISNSVLEVTQVFCLIYCIFYAKMRTNFSPSP